MPDQTMDPIATTLGLLHRGDFACAWRDSEGLADACHQLARGRALDLHEDFLQLSATARADLDQAITGWAALANRVRSLVSRRGG